MSETKRVPSWGEIHKVERAAEAIESASAAATSAALVVDESEPNYYRLGGVLSANHSAIKWLRLWLEDARAARESEDLERKKAGLS